MDWIQLLYLRQRKIFITVFFYFQVLGEKGIANKEKGGDMFAFNRVFLCRH